MNENEFSGESYDADGHRADVIKLLQGGRTNEELLVLRSERVQTGMVLDGADDCRRGALSDAAVLDIFKRASANELQKQIAYDYGISQKQVSQIFCGTRYAHVTAGLRRQRAEFYQRHRQSKIGAA